MAGHMRSGHFASKTSVCTADHESFLTLPTASNSEIPNADYILHILGASNCYVIFVMTTLSFSWTMVAMPLMCSAFITDDGTCEDNVTICNAENRTSLSSEFSLVGESKYRAEWSTSALLIGNMIGASVLTHLSDRSGRRPVLIASLLLLGTLGILTALSPTLNMITFGRFLQGICSPGVSLVGWVLAFESIPSSLRGFTTFVFGATWVLGYCLIAPLAYFTDNWRTLMLASTAPAIVLAILYMLVIPESLHFLITSGQKSAAIRWVKTAQSYKCDNRQKILLNEVEQMLACSTKMRESSAEAVASKRAKLFEEINRNKVFILYTVVLIWLWTTDAFVYFGLSLYSTKLAGNRYLNYVLSGLIELPAYAFAPPALHRFGRKPVIVITHLLAGVSLIGPIFIPIGPALLSTVFWLIGKFAISCSFMCIFVYGSELFPTTIRNACIGLCSLISRGGGTLAPYVELLAVISPSVPTIFFGSVSLFAGLLTLLLPETKDRILPSSLKEVADTKNAAYSYQNSAS